MESRTESQFAEWVATIRRHEVGRSARIETPFGSRLLCYADLTATGRYLRFVERWIESVRPFYANTHTEVSSTGRLLTGLREQSRNEIRRAVGASDEDEVVFVGAGATAAVNKLVGLLGLRVSETLDREFGWTASIPRDRRPVVFVGPYEHHSNLLPWIESVADVVEIDLDDEGCIDRGALDEALLRHAARPLKIGSFSAASNVTGVLSDVGALARVLHRRGALAFFDFAAAGPYVPIRMHPPDPDERIDALFLSTHKFVGGPECSGLLVAHRALFRTQAPERPGGGTVDYVSGPERGSIDYVGNLAEREEGGTPDIIGDLRAGAAFLVKEMLGPERIRDHEIELADRAVRRLAAHPRVRILGPLDAPRLAILSFSIEGLHHDLASALLDHLFGIQNRAGCACAGPYGHSLLGIDRERSLRFRKLLHRGLGGMKPGWVRLSIPYYATDEDVEFLLAAVEFVADHGESFVPLYRFGWDDGVWQHAANDPPAVSGLRLDAAAIEAAALGAEPGPAEPPIDEARMAAERARYFEEARSLAAELAARWRLAPPEWNRPTGDAELDELVWFRFVHADRLP